MLSALKPNDSVYDVTKFYKKLTRKKLKRQQKNPLKKLPLPKLTGYKILEQNLSQILTISSKNSFKINHINLKYINFQNNPNDTKKEENFVRNPVLSESNKNIKLPKLQSRKNFFSEKNSPKKPQRNFSCLYLKYEGENYFNEVNKKIYIKIFPQKIIHSIKNIMNRDKNMINKIEQKINKMVDKYTTMSNLNFDFNTMTINLNEIIDSEENKYILLTENNNNSNNRLFKIKNIFLENIIQNVVTHSIEIRNQKNNIILRAEIENELKNQLYLLKKFFVSEINNKKHNRMSDDYKKIDIKKIKIIKAKKHLLKTYSKIITSDFGESQNYLDSIINRRDKGYLTERNNGNKEIFNLFKTKLDITKNKTFHDLYYNIITTKSNYISSTQTTSNFEMKKINTNTNIIIKKEKDNNINKNKENILKFYKNYFKIKDDLNLKNDKKAKDQEYIFKLKPNLKFVDFKEIVDEINEINVNKKLDINKSINNEKLFFLIMSDESLLKEIKFKNVKNKNVSKFFSDKSKEFFVPTKKNKILKQKTDVLKKLGDKLHKKIKVKLGRNKRRIKFKDSSSNKTEYNSKNKNEEDFNNSRMTENKIIDSDTNSSVFSDIPSDLSMSYSEMIKEKEENAKKIKKFIENNEIFNDENIIDIDELFFKSDKLEEKNNYDNNKNESKEINDNNDNEKEEKQEEDNKDTFIVYDNKGKFDNKKVNMTNLMIKDKIKKRKIKYIYVNNDLEKVKTKFNEKGNQTSINSIKNEKEKSNINNDNSKSKNISQNKDKVDNIKNSNIKNNKSHSNKKEIDELKSNEGSTNKKKIKIEKKSIYGRNSRRNKYSKNKSNKTNKSNKFNYSEKKTNENEIENDINNMEYEQLMIFYNNKFNIPGKNNKIKKKFLSKSVDQQANNDKSSFYNESKSKKETFMNNIKDIQKDKLIRYKSISFFKTRNDKKLILLKAILRHILYRKNRNLKKIRDTLNKIFNVSHADILGVNLDIKPKNQGKINQYKNLISYEHTGNYENYKNHRILVEKYFGSRLKIEQNYYLDDIDLLLENKYGRKKRIYKRKKLDNKKGFKQFMNDDMNKGEYNYIDDFEELQKENERIRSYIEAEKEKKKRRIKETEDKFNNFKLYIKRLKNMTDDQLKYDAIRFIFKIKTDEDNNLKAKRIKRINDFKKYIKINEMNKLNNNKSILKNVFFQSNCVFHTDKLFSI